MSLQLPDMSEYDGIHPPGPITTSNQFKVSIEDPSLTDIDMPSVVCDMIREALTTIARGSDHEHDTQRTATGNPSKIDRRVRQLPESQNHIIGTRYRGVLRCMQQFKILAVMLVRPIVAAASPVGSNDPGALRIEDDMGHSTLFGPEISSAQLLLCYFAFSGMAAGLVYLQRSNPYLKHNFLVCSAALYLVSLCKGTESMFKMMPWVTMGMLLISGLHYALTEVISATLSYTGRDGRTGSSTRTVKHCLAQRSEHQPTDFEQPLEL